MKPTHFDRIIQNIGTAMNRRTLLQGAAAVTTAVLGGAILLDVAEAKTLCRKNGTRCKKQSKTCQAKYCLKAPFTIEARWSRVTDHDTFLYVPKKAGSDEPFPVINQDCTPAKSKCEDDVYPFVCVSKDATGPGDEFTTVRRVLDGTYEYWIALQKLSPAGDLKVILRNANSRIIRSWSSPANPDAQSEHGWHVFDIHGATHRITSVNAVTNTDLPHGAHKPSTYVCPK